MPALRAFDRQLHRALIQRATAADPEDARSSCLTYTELGLAVDPAGTNAGYTRKPFRPMFPALGRVSHYEVAHGRPMLSALVVSQANHEPGEGFGQLATTLGFVVDDGHTFWQSQVDAVVRFWNSQDPILLLDAAIDQVTEELGEIKNTLRKLVEGTESPTTGEARSV